MSFYTLDGTTRKLLRLERFGQPDFAVKSFIEQLSGAQSHLDSDRRLDPKPYIRTFEAAANELERLHEIALNQEEAAATASMELSESRNLEIQDMVTNVSAAVRDVKALDEYAAEIQQITGLESTKLEHISHEHSQIEKYRALVTAYFSFLDGKLPTGLSRHWGSDMRKKSAFVAQLQEFATNIGDINGKRDVLTQIDKYAENLEKQLLENFLESYQNFDLVGMRECAEILTEFNGGGSVVQAYINQHRFFMNVDQLQPEEGNKVLSQNLWEELISPRSTYEEFSSIIDQEVKEITDTIARETEIITKVFPKPTQVLSMFIQRTFAQKVQGMVTMYMDDAANQERFSSLAQVRVLSVCYTQVNNLVNDLQNTWSKSKSALDAQQQGELSEVLESNFIDIFVLYKDDYFQLEEASLGEITENEFRGSAGLRSSYNSTRSFANSSSSSNGNVVPNTLQRSTTSATSYGAEDGRIERLKRMWSTRSESNSNSNNTQENMSSDGQMSPNGTAGNISINLNNISNSPSADNSVNIDSPSYFSRTPLYQRWQKLLDIPASTLHNVLDSFGEAIAREQVLREPEQFAADATVLYNLLTHEIGGRYISAIIDDALEISYKVDTKQPIDWTFIESIQRSGNALRFVSTFVKTVLFAMVQSSPESQIKMATALNSYIQNVQRSCCELTEHVSELMHLRTKALFNKNSRKEFLEPQGDSIVSPDLMEEFQNLEKQVTTSLSTENSKRLLKLVAINFCNDMLENILQYTISIEGGTALSTDIAEYERLMTQEWGLSGEVSERFATLRAISRLFTADQTLLVSLLRDSHLSKLSSSQIRAYLGQRADNTTKLMNMLYFQGSLQQNKRY